MLQSNVWHPGMGLPTGVADATLVTIGADQTNTVPTPIFFSAFRLEIAALSISAPPSFFPKRIMHRVGAGGVKIRTNWRARI